ncbi:MAG: hypothetical protein SNH35_01470 [Rikenellaceae bacterium]
MKKTAYIHVGMPKTGTSAIQSTLQRFFREGKLDKFDMQFHSSNISRNIHHLSYTGDVEFFAEQTHKKIRKHSKIGAKNVIYSSEHIAAVFDNKYKGVRVDLLPALATAFKDYNIKIIIYIRRQDILIESLINQHFKSGRYTTYDNTKFYYKELLDKCSELFGGEVIVRKYEQGALYQSDVVTDFLQIIGLEELIDDYKKKKGKTVNSSLAPKACRIAAINNQQYALNEAEIESKVEHVENQYKNGVISRSAYITYMYDYLRGIDQQKFPYSAISTQSKILKMNSSFSYSTSNQGLFSAEDRMKIMAQYAEDNAAVAREYFGCEDGKLFNDKMPKEVVDINEEPSVADVIQAVMPVLINLTQRCERLERPLLKRFFLDRKDFGKRVWEKLRLKYARIFNKR